MISNTVPLPTEISNIKLTIPKNKCWCPSYASALTKSIDGGVHTSADTGVHPIFIHTLH